MIAKRKLLLAAANRELGQFREWKMSKFIHKNPIQNQLFRCSNSATSVENEIYKCDTYTLDSDESSSGDDEESDDSAEIPSPRILRKIRIDSPEIVQKRKEVFEKWEKKAK